MKKTLIMSAVPSLDTPVCELQTKRINQEAASLPITVLAISMDLLFAQRRFCESFMIERVVTLSDFRDREFAHAYGLYIKETGLIARAVFVIDAHARIAYREIVADLGSHPDYAAALNAVRGLLAE
jgi:thiol peroxidase